MTEAARESAMEPSRLEEKLEEINQSIEKLSDALLHAAIGKNQIPEETVKTILAEISREHERQGKIFHRVIFTLCVVNGVLLAWATGVKFALPTDISAILPRESHAETN